METPEEHAEEIWLENQEDNVGRYLDSQGCTYGGIGAAIFTVFPYVSFWEVYSPETTPQIAWYAISGDLPTDYIEINKGETPSEALSRLAQNWIDAAELMIEGRRPETFTIGYEDVRQDLAPLLRSRALLLLRWADDHSIWA